MLRYLALRQAAVVGKLHHLALGAWQMVQRRPHRVAQVQDLGGICNAERLRILVAGQGRVFTESGLMGATPQQIDGAIPGDANQLCCNPASGRVVRFDAIPTAQKRVLHDFFRKLAVAHNPEGQRENQRSVPIVQHRESLLIMLPEPLHHGLVHQRLVRIGRRC